MRHIAMALSSTIALMSVSLLAQDTNLPDFATRVRGADDKQAIPLSVAAHSLVLSLITRDKQRPGDGVLLVSQVFDVEVDEATKFIVDANESYQSYRRNIAQVARSICTKKIASATEWAAAMTANEKAYQRLKADMIEDLHSKTASGLWERFMARADDARESTSITTTNYFTLVEQQDYQTLLARSRAGCSEPQ
jgi:hypothetical protein